MPDNIQHRDIADPAEIHEAKQIAAATTADHGKILTPSATEDGVGELVSVEELSGFVLDHQVFNVSGEWNKPPNVLDSDTVYIRLWGGGGGGNAESGRGCTGAGGGGYADLSLRAHQLAAQEDVVVGAGGARSPSGDSGEVGEKGGTSSFGSLFEATGGRGSYAQGGSEMSFLNDYSPLGGAPKYLFGANIELREHLPHYQGGHGRGIADMPVTQVMNYPNAVYGGAGGANQGESEDVSPGSGPGFSVFGGDGAYPNNDPGFPGGGGNGITTPHGAQRDGADGLVEVFVLRGWHPIGIVHPDALEEPQQ